MDLHVTNYCAFLIRILIKCVCTSVNKKSFLTYLSIVLVVERIRNTQDNLKLRLRDGEELVIYFHPLVRHVMILNIIILCVLHSFKTWPSISEFHCIFWSKKTGMVLFRGSEILMLMEFIAMIYLKRPHFG